MTGQQRNCPFCASDTEQYALPEGASTAADVPYTLAFTLAGVWHYRLFLCLKCLRPNLQAWSDQAPKMDLRSVCRAVNERGR